ncbi:MAG: carbohydrate-binding domain-containing protein [Clostridiales bacterium]|nr:carbohydrate-binding domain-containing protein [Clostridiales bacterium]
MGKIFGDFSKKALSLTLVLTLFLTSFSHFAFPLRVQARDIGMVGMISDLNYIGWEDEKTDIRMGILMDYLGNDAEVQDAITLMQSDDNIINAFSGDLSSALIWEYLIWAFCYGNMEMFNEISGRPPGAPNIMKLYTWDFSRGSSNRTDPMPVYMSIPMSPWTDTISLPVDEEEYAAYMDYLLYGEGEPMEKPEMVETPYNSAVTQIYWGNAVLERGVIFPRMPELTRMIFTTDVAPNGDWSAMFPNIPNDSSCVIEYPLGGVNYTAEHFGPAFSNWQFVCNEKAAGTTTTHINIGTVSGDGDGYIYADNTVILTGGYNYEITGVTAANKVVVESGKKVKVTLNDALIDVSAASGACAFDMTGATVYLTLVGENTLKSGVFKAALQVPNGATLTIDGGGKLESDGGEFCAGIGGGFSEEGGTITINSGTITAIGGTIAAGIGGGGDEGGGNGEGGGKITINGGKITAIGGELGAGIGDAYNEIGSSDCGEVTITGGTINAIGGSYAPGIGGGIEREGGKITISGGTITAVGYEGGAGIGRGYEGVGGEITISGGVVTATGGEDAAGIGGGYNGDSGEITITGGTITAMGGTNGAAIGGGYTHLATGTVTIDGGSVNVNNFNGPQPKNSELEDVYFSAITLGDPPAANVPVTSFKAEPVVSVASVTEGTYGINDVYTDDSGNIYVWLPDSGGDDEEMTVKAGGKTYAGIFVRAADNNNAQTLAKAAGVEDVKVRLTPDELAKNAGSVGYISVSLADAVGYEAYALAIPMLFDNDIIEITDLETVGFGAKGLTGLLVNGTSLKSARDYDSSSEVASVINADGKFLLSWSVGENTPFPHTLTDDVYFKIHYRVKKNVPTSEGFAIGEYNDTNGITGDQIFGIDGLGIMCSNQGDFGAYLLVEGEHGILTPDYVNITVEDMPAVTISGDVNSISLQGRAMLTGKQRTAIPTVGYTPDLNKMDAGICVEMYEVDAIGGVVKQVGSVAYTREMNMAAAFGNPASTLCNYTLKISRIVANDLANSDPDGGSPKYMLRFWRYGDDGGSEVGTVREESYLWAEIYLDGTGVIAGEIDESEPMTVGGTAYLYAGAFYLPDVDKIAISTADLNTIRGQVGNADIEGVTTIFNINEYLGVDAADYTTVLRYVGQQKLQSIPLVVSH